MSDGSSSVNKKLRLGIEAARAGQNNVARVHLEAVLKIEPQNIPAMLWLAFVLPSPQDTIRWLERVLALDPNNERARAGIRWARGQLSREPEPAKPAATAANQTPAKPPPQTAPLADGESIRRKLLSSDDAQKKAKKGVLAHRARRTLDSMVILIIILSVLGMMAIGLGALTFVPTDTLAAWLPVATPTSALPVSFEVSSPVVESSPVAAEEAPSAPTVSRFISEADTIIIEKPQSTEPETAEAVSPALSIVTGLEPLPEVAEPSPLAETNFVSVEPSIFIGPALSPAEPEILEPVENLILAHQPAYPGEKWIEVNVTTQQVTAWEGDRPVFSFIVSTGLPSYPTIQGEFHIYWKLESALMTGPGYYLPEVPYTMYFYGGYALHGTYWHHNFGQPMSHGCVNLETGNAKDLFEWADPILPPGQTQVVATADNPGTLVVVHD